LELGLAVEWSLAHRLFQPLREAWRSAAPASDPAGRATESLGEGVITAQVARFLDGQVGHLMLGPMVAALQMALHHAPGGENPLDRLLLGFCARLPNPAPLLVLQPEVRKRRARALEALRELRNRCAHPSEPPAPAQIADHWQAMVEDPEHAFYRYFGQTFLHDGPVPAEARAD